MMVVDPDRWRMIGPLIDHALDLSDEEQTGWLAELRAVTPDLAAEVAELLEGEVEADARQFLASPLEPTLAGRQIGAYRLEQPLASGGMGCVWLARRADGRFEGRAAVKFLNLALSSADGQDQFRREGCALARLAHPGIARLLDAGVSTGGQPYLVLEYVEGMRIDAYADAHALSVAERIRLVLQVLAAVEHAHANLIVHRDLKPSNILVTPEGAVKLLDFGLAKLLQPATALVHEAAPRTTRRWMTPEYAAPEQVRGEPITTCTDVYQLGAVLYLLLTGRVPFTGASVHDLEAAVLQEDPIAPSLAARSGGALRGDLDAIVLKAMRKEPEHRYPSATALAEDLRRHLDAHPVRARRQTALYRARRFVRRRRAEALAALVIAAMLGGAAATALSEARRAHLERARAELASRESEAVTRFLLGLFDASDRDGVRSDTLRAQDLLDLAVARAERLRDPPAARVRMLDVAGRAYLRLGRYDKAIAVFDRALALRGAQGEEDLLLASTLAAQAEALLRVGRLGAADTAARRALAIRRRFLPDAPEVAATLQQFAELALYRGELTTAEAWLRDAIRIGRGASGQNGPSTAGAVRHRVVATGQ